MVWQPISTGPRDGREVLVYFEEDCTNALAQELRIAYWDDIDECWRDQDDRRVPATHWQPLPEVPR